MRESETSYPHLPLVTAGLLSSCRMECPKAVVQVSFPSVGEDSAHTSVAPPMGTVLALKARWERGYGSEQGRQSSSLLVKTV